MSDYDYLDQYEGHFDREVAHREKTFDEPFDHGPLDIIENSIENTTPLHQDLSAVEHSIESSLEPPMDYYTGPPAPTGNEIIERSRAFGFREPDLVNPFIAPGENRSWYQPPVPPLRPGNPKMARGEYKPSPVHGLSPKAPPYKLPEKTWCPLREEKIPVSECTSSCPHYNTKARYHGNCELKQKEADKLAGKKSEEGDDKE